MARIWNTLHAIGPFQFHRISRSVGGSQLGYLLLLFSWLPFLKLNDYFHKRVRYHSVIVELVTIELNIFFLITIISVHFYFFINFILTYMKPPILYFFTPCTSCTMTTRGISCLGSYWDSDWFVRITIKIPIDEPWNHCLLLWNKVEIEIKINIYTLWEFFLRGIL